MLKSKKDEKFIEAIEHIFKKTSKNFNVLLWDGEILKYTDTPDFILKFNDEDVFKKILLKPSAITFAEAFMDKSFDIEGNIFKALELKDELSDMELSTKEKLNILIKSSPLSTLTSHTKENDKKYISHHYDISNDFYKLFLGPTMTYSCAYFKDKDNDITTAQINKIEHICKKLQLKSGQKLLDVGCGWGTLIIWAAKNYGVEAHGVTISEEQYKYVCERIKEEHLEGKCFVELMDYRDIKGEEIYDRIVSIGMFEHVGVKNLPLYFQILNRLLKEDGLFLNHGITHSIKSTVSEEEAEFIDKYIFPGGELHTISGIQTIMEESNYEIYDVESLREHYFKTLNCWVNNLLENKEKAISYASERIYRTWILYMAGCALTFRAGNISVYQVLLGKMPNKIYFNNKLTRDYMYK
ncbi:class I SAM-dependent methyltransferase [Clostridium sp. 19966]|uniref:class I SAM-dependent methyltransferase n=1 Tax=Clostridium sp. 19966 TaxID=2768166 RepID=UPI0028DD94C6|nr:class I SAM-dependent methyltransferase [Clostridium sp. 19966]MDT8716290.1 class I SAM-dependent methyltransferase [Clostridium sp. 19966]